MQQRVRRAGWRGSARGAGGRFSLEDRNCEAQEPSTSLSTSTSERTRLGFLLI